MESELQKLPPKTTQTTQLESVDESSLTKDDRPLLKPDPTNPQLQVQSQSSSSNPCIEELEKKYAPYVRHDVYGVMGRGELPWTEKVLLGIALVTVVPVRVVGAMTVLVVYYLICKVCTAFSAPNREEEEEQEDYAHIGGWRRVVMMQSGMFLSRVMLFVFGFYWISETYCPIDLNANSNNEHGSKDQTEELERPGAIVSNHISYLDILYHMSSSFPSFVAKRSVAKLPLVGLISKCLGCVYVQRESKSPDFKGVSGVVNERIREAHQNKSAPIMLLFPEGTTTNGDFLLPFKSGAFLSGAPVQPVILRYPYQRLSPAWDSISGVRHVILLLCQFVNYVEATWLPVYYPSQQEKDDPRLYAENVRRLMAHEGNLILSDIGLAEKRVYHAALNGNNSMPTVFHQKDD
ncbi:lysophospholipid acyltransferase LPEAT1 isoform X1 [Nicotiana tabacum]|uniref:Lysophospholipid acyltransferase LPEAT1 isoform X1 n=2 Tax=Nicotiana TaxID=4085 RepID=A0A1S4DHI8_TOBAC|nr:PREDICTED: lysophospholipid acyltransferase LPEAT1 isoform X1 [Nicotiana sylvestris]XP_016512833.1 PREDICTED: lysophospholipid acyltransferase LPEAT1-like isoform X1 [Nicotiana tabacum]